MRLATACVLLSVLLPASAQDLPPEAYYPLDVGNEWVYTFQFGGPRVLQHDRIVGTETVGGIDYTLRERCELAVTDDGPGTPACELQRIRFTDTRDLVVRQPDGSEVAEACAVGAPAGTVVACDDVVGEDFELEVFQTGPTAVVVGQHAVAVAGAQSYDVTEGGFDPPPAGFALGIGRLTTAFGNDVARFEYARVGDAEYGVDPLGPAPARFDPIAVGTVREYEVPGPDGPGQVLPHRRDIPRTLVVGGQTWAIERTQTLLPADADGARVRSESRRLVRFDEASAQTVTRGADGGGVPLYPCALDAPRGTSACGDGFATRRDAATVRTAPADERTTSVLELDGLGGSLAFVAGIGLVAQQGDGSPSGTALVYADVGPLPTGDPLPFGTPLGEAFPTEIDPTPAHRYYPLSVGDEWHYTYGVFGVPQTFRRRVVVGTEAVGDEVYAVVRSERATPDDPVWAEPSEALVRFDSLSGFPVAPDGYRLSSCPLDEPVHREEALFDSPVLCNAERSTVAARFDGPLQQTGGPTISTEGYREMVYVGLADGVGAEIYVVGIGRVPKEYPFVGGAFSRLAYARVRQDDGSTRTVGAPLPVGAESTAPRATLAVAAAPNPTGGELRLTVAVPAAGALTAEVFDALGRRVWVHAAEAASGPSELRVDARAWAPGAYVVRVRAGEGVATTRVVRR